MIEKLLDDVPMVIVADGKPLRDPDEQNKWILLGILAGLFLRPSKRNLKTRFDKIKSRGHDTAALQKCWLQSPFQQWADEIFFPEAGWKV